VYSAVNNCRIEINSLFNKKNNEQNRTKLQEDKKYFQYIRWVS
jgi:hypothetical protein